MHRILFSLFVLTAVARPGHAIQEFVAPSAQKEIVVALEGLISEHYVLDEGARRLVDGLKQAARQGEFDAPMPMTEFITRTNGVLQRAFPDRHLGILSPARYQDMQRRFHSGDSEPEGPHDGGKPPSGIGHRAPESAGPNEDTRADSLLEVAGISRVAEINRDGLNQVGYLALQRFDGSPRAVAAIDRIFHTFSDSERLIIDLRECGGGDADMVKVLSSYLFAERTHLVSGIGHRDAQGHRPMSERWTTPNALSPTFAGKQVNVLISKKTFSAAESFAFGLKVTGRARLIGQPSGGGGHMNDFYPLPGGLGASISVGRTYDPRTGKGWEAAGIAPDVVTQIDHALSDTLALITRESGKLGAMSVEETAIYSKIMDYANAWYAGDAERMAGLLDPDFQASLDFHGRECP